MALAVEADAHPGHFLLEAELARLRTENAGLRELLEISGIELGEYSAA